MIEPNTTKVISMIADIQIEALNKLKDNPNIISKDYLMKLVEAKEDEITEAIEKLICIYEDIKQAPELLNMLTEYQTSLCSYILWRMEAEWLEINQEGVLGAWALIIRAQNKFHPEYQAILNLI